MEIACIVEPHDGGYRARVRHPVVAVATGASRSEATRALEAALRAAGVPAFILLPLESTPDKPWLATAGSIPDDEPTDEWLDAVAEYRRERDAEDSASLPPTPTQPVP